MRNRFSTVFLTTLCLLFCSIGLNAQTRTQDNALFQHLLSAKTGKTASVYIVENPSATSLSSGYARITLTAGDVWGDGSGYQMLLDSDHNIWETMKDEDWPEEGDVPASTYAKFEYKIPENADGSTTTSNIVLNNSITIDIPAGVYDYVITNPVPGEWVWPVLKEVTYGNDYTFLEWKHYTFEMYMDATDDNCRLTVKDFTPDNPCPQVASLSYVVDGGDIVLTWQAPAGDPPTGYTIYNGYTEYTSVQEPGCTLSNLPAGKYVFGVSPIYDNGCTPMKVSIPEIEIASCKKVTGLSIAYTDDCKARISWKGTDASPIRSQTLWDNTDVNLTNAAVASVLWTDGEDMLSADDFVADDTWIIERVMFDGFYGEKYETFDYLGITIFSDNSGKPDVALYKDEQIPIAKTTDGYMDAVLSTPYQLPARGTYWVSFYGVSSVASPDKWDTDDEEVSSKVFFLGMGSKQKGYSFYQRDTKNLAGYGSDWMYINGYPSLIFKLEGTLPAIGSTRYNVYRDGVRVAKDIEATSYIDEGFDTDVEHEWAVTMVCPRGGESDKTTFNKGTCQVGIAGAWAESLKVYPNPASNVVTILGQGIQKVEIYNALGQLMAVSDGNVQSVDVASYNTGLYFFKIYDSNSNVAVKRVMVAR